MDAEWSTVSSVQNLNSGGQIHFPLMLDVFTSPLYHEEDVRQGQF